MKDNNAFNEMMVHIPLCTHKEASNVLIIGTVDEDFKIKLLNTIKLQILNLEMYQHLLLKKMKKN